MFLTSVRKEHIRHIRHILLLMNALTAGWSYVRTISRRMRARIRSISGVSAMMRKISKALSLGCVAAAIHIASTQGWASSSASGGAPIPIDDPPVCTGSPHNFGCGTKSGSEISCTVTFAKWVVEPTKTNRTHTALPSTTAPECIDVTECNSNTTFPVKDGCLPAK